MVAIAGRVLGFSRIGWSTDVAFGLGLRASAAGLDLGCAGFAVGAVVES